MDVSFTDQESWEPPFYELYIELGPHPGALSQMHRAFEALWAHPTLEGPYADNSIEPADQPKIDIAAYVSADGGHMLGVATFPDGNRAPCGCVPHVPDLASTLSLSDEIHQGLGLDYGPQPLDPGPDAFTFYLPGGAIHDLYEVDLWMDGLDGRLQRELEDWLADIARTIFERATFEVGAIGAEGSYNPERLHEDGAEALLRPSEGGTVELIRVSAGHG